MTVRQAMAIIGAFPGGKLFGQTSKMPGRSYGLDAFACKRGSYLAQQPGTPCSACYARRNFYATWTPVIKNRESHQQAVAHPDWVEAMAFLMRRRLAGERFFRMHDSGDLIDTAHLEKIAQIAERVPWLQIWLPTHEPFTVAAWRDLRGGAMPPANLVIRLSADYNDQPPQWTGRMAGLTRKRIAELLADLPTSTTHTVVGKPVQVSGRRKDSIECQAHTRDHKCGPCRACWSPKVRNVSYPLTSEHGHVSTQLRLHVIQ